jgi:hypothetical protein
MRTDQIIEQFRAGLINKPEALEMIAERSRLAEYNKRYTDDIHSYQRWNNVLRDCRAAYRDVKAA